MKMVGGVCGAGNRYYYNLEKYETTKNPAGSRLGGVSALVAVLQRQRPSEMSSKLI
jgi:hypothetical protein